MNSDALRERIAKVVHDENERIRSADTNRNYNPLGYDELGDEARENRRSVAQAVIDDLRLTTVEMTLGGEKEDGTPFTSVRLVGQWEEVREPPPRTRRLKACVDEWPDCEEGEYHPLCCRFPKSCSCTVYDPERVSPEDLEDLP